MDARWRASGTTSNVSGASGCATDPTPSCRGLGSPASCNVILYLRCARSVQIGLGQLGNVDQRCCYRKTADIDANGCKFRKQHHGLAFSSSIVGWLGRVSIHQEVSQIDYWMATAPRATEVPVDGCTYPY